MCDGQYIPQCWKFIQVSLCQKLQKSIDTRLSYCKNKKGAVFETLSRTLYDCQFSFLLYSLFFTNF